MDASAARENVLTRSAVLLRWGLGISLFSIPVAMAESWTFTLLLGAGMMLALVGVVWRMFGVIQLRMTELLLLIAVLGNIYGWLATAMFGGRGSRGLDDVPLFLFIAVGTLVWILGAVTNGLLIAVRLGEEETSARIVRVGFFLIYPIAIALVPICVLSTFICFTQGSALFALALGIGIFGGWIWCYGRELQNNAAVAQFAREAQARARNAHVSN